MNTAERYVYRSPDETMPRAITNGGQNVVTLGAAMVSSPVEVCPAWGCGGPPRAIIFERPPVPAPVAYPIAYPWLPGATALVPQPPAGSGGTLLVPNPGSLPLSPQPSPVVGAPTSISLTDPGTTLDSTGASVTTSFDLMAWLGESTLFTGFTNWEVAGAGLLAAWFLFFRGKRR
jgi:hypothetical protein